MDIINKEIGGRIKEIRKKRPYQRIPDYYEHIKNGRQEKLFEEIVVQFGDMETCGLKSGKWEEAKLMLRVCGRNQARD